MPATLDQVMELLDGVEPEYEQAQELGPGIAPLLEALIEGEHAPTFAPRAIYLAGLIGGDEAARIVYKAIRSPNREYRLQAAATARNLPPKSASPVLHEALGDRDLSVRKFALDSIGSLPTLPSELAERIGTMAQSDDAALLRDMSRRVLAGTYSAFHEEDGEAPPGN